MQLKATIDSQLNLFPGLDVVDVMMLTCNSVGDDGESVLEEFTELVNEDVRPEISNLFAECMRAALVV